MTKPVFVLVVFLGAVAGYSDSTHINLDLSEPPPTGTKQIVFGSGLYAASAFGPIAAIYFYEDEIDPNRARSCIDSDLSIIMMASLGCVASAVTGTIVLHRGMKKRRIYLTWKFGQCA
jgi:hypothetical protein